MRIRATPTVALNHFVSLKYKKKSKNTFPTASAFFLLAIRLAKLPPRLASSGERLPLAKWPKSAARFPPALLLAPNRIPAQINSSPLLSSRPRSSAPVAAAASHATLAAAMYRPPRSRSTAAGVPGLYNRSMEAGPFSQFAAGREETVGDLDGSRPRRSPVDLLNGEEFHGEEAYTGGLDPGYYTDLLVNGVEQSQELSPTSSEPPIHLARSTAKSSQGRSKNFREEEDILLVSAWLNVGMDPIQGVDQTQGTFWKRIHAYFHANKTFKFESKRTESSLMNRWSGIQHDVNLFCGCLSKIETRHHSGWTVDDKISSACAMFTKEDPKDRKFVLLHCWRILKDQPKWIDRRRDIGCAKKTSNKKQKTVANSSPASAPVAPAASPDVGDEGQPSVRPDGKKKEKQKLRQHSTIEALDYLMVKKKEADNEKDLKKEERCNRAFALQEERIKVEKEKIQVQRELEEERLKLDKEKFHFERDQDEERILNLDLSTMNYKLQQYYAVRQEEILARCCNI